MHPADPRVALLRDQLVGQVLEGTDGVRFHLRELIGEGGQGWIYKGNYDEPDGVLIVVKVLRPDGLSEDTLHRFQREAKVLRQLGAQANPNPNLVRFYDHGVARLTPPNSHPSDKVELPFTVLEFVHGVTLAQIIQEGRGAGISVARARRLLRQVAWGLTSVHAQNIVHRDLKPSNILVASDHGIEVAKITDFGLAKLSSLTAHKTTMLAGASLGYAPPEQYEKGNERVSPRTDVFSLAAIVYECLSGQPAFALPSGESGALRLIQEMMTGPRPALARAAAISPELRVRPDVVAGVDAQLARATQPQPEARPATVREFWDAIEPLLRSAAEPSMRPSGRGSNPAASPSAYPPPAGAAQHGREPPFGFAGQPVYASPRGPSAHPAFASPLGSAPPPAQGTGARPAQGSEPAPPRVSLNPRASSASERLALQVAGRLGVEDRLRKAVIAPDGRAAFALGSAGLYRWISSSWGAIALPRWLDPRSLRGMVLFPDTSVLIFGDEGTIAVVSPNDEVRPWPNADHDLDLCGAAVDGRGVVLVGTRRSRPVGVFVEAAFGRPPLPARTIDNAPTLRAATRLTGGALVACGDDGALVRLDVATHAAIPWERTGHLTAIAARPDGGALVVGTGGHALSISPALQVKLEAVQTTHDLGSVAIASDGTAWAGASDRRLLRRRGTTWERVRFDVELAEQTAILFAQPIGDWLLAVTSDGQMLQGRIAQ
jgi:serine/threonine-protein kinase